MLDLINVKKGDKVWVISPAEARDLCLELNRQILVRGAVSDLDVYFEEAKYDQRVLSGTEMLDVTGPASVARIATCDKFISIWVHEDNTLDYEKIPEGESENFPSGIFQGR